MKISKKIAFFVLSMTSLCTMTAGVALSSFGKDESVISCGRCGDKGHKYVDEGSCGCGKKKKKNHSLNELIV